MHYAAANGHEDVITVLLSFKAEIDYSRKKGVFFLIFLYDSSSYCSEVRIS